ncbi:hemolysin family protein [Micropruina sonneratiae]|uniref:hemolysin family protein n=1 Tax=Micropruina sonneratiae TaxID=2986940 RepID=UPI002226E308|nr:hemolysin family protein [Micropruina sp. KQZ13P-5]MCW3159477.1 hemolysin family protein [Micropruina sp. KQZ13P-5]
MSSEVWGILAGIVLTIGTGLFVASEFALVNLDRADLEQRRARGEKRLTTTINALNITSTHLSSAQLGITLTTLLAGYTFEPAISSLLRGPLLGMGLPETLVPTVGAVTAIALATLFSMILGELVPKNFALAVPLATAKLVVPFQAAFTFVFKPAVALLNGTANRLIRAMGIEPKEELYGARSAEELSFLVRRSATEGSLDSDDAAMLHRTLLFAGHSADEVMTPRVRAVTLPSTASADDVVATAAATGHSRFPILGDDIDHIAGVVHVKAAYGVPVGRRGDVAVTELMVPPVLVPESAGVDSLLGTLRGRGYQIAIVVDEHGGTAGVVTLEDLVEELLGEVHDEHDLRRHEIVRHADSILISGGIRPDELWERSGVRVPEGEHYDTAAGFVLDELEHIPTAGEEVRLERGTLRVERLAGPRITRLRYLPDDPETDPAFGAPGSGSWTSSSGRRTHERVPAWPDLAGRPAGCQRVLRRGRVRRHLGAPLTDRAQGGGR